MRDTQAAKLRTSLCIPVWLSLPTRLLMSMKICRLATRKGCTPCRRANFTKESFRRYFFCLGKKYALNAKFIKSRNIALRIIDMQVSKNDAQYFILYSYRLLIKVQDQRSARIGLCKKSSYARRIPASNSVLYVHPRAVSFEISSNFLGVPSGLEMSHSIRPL